MALVNTGSDDWFIEYEACERLSREIMEQMSLRDNERPRSSQFDALSAKIRVRLKQYIAEVAQLNNKLRQASVVSSLTNDERNRRLQQVNQLQSYALQLEDQFNKPGGVELAQTKGKNVVLSSGTTGWGGDDDDEPEMERIQNLPTSSLRSQQQEMMQVQDQGLENLSRVIARQKQIATVITNEVDDQNEILDEISTGMDRVETRVRGETDMIRTIGRKDSTWGYWVVIIILLIVILAVSFA